MAPSHVTHITPLLLSSFGIGIGLVTVMLLLNFVAETVKRVRRNAARRDLPSFADRDERLLVQPMPRPRPPTGPAVMPVVPRRPTR